MRKELEARFVTRWPTWFKIGRHTLMPDGFEFGDGWFDIVWRLCEGLEPLVAEDELNTADPFEVSQIKEKFGGLYFRTDKTRFDKSHDAILHLIAAAEQQSLVTCDVCGQPGTTQGKGWIRTRCEAHPNVRAKMPMSIEEMIEEINLLDSIANSDEAHDDTSSGLKKPNQQG
jgi:hypothetical protein